MQTPKIVSALALLLAPSIYGAGAPTAKIAPKPAAVAKKPDPFLNGAPFTFDQILALLKQKAIPLRRRKDAIQSRGLSFAVSTEVVAKLKAAGATDDVLKLIKSKEKTAEPAPPPPLPVAAPAPPPAPKRQPTGTLAVSCAPGECEITLNGTSRGSTLGGKLEITAFPAGTWDLQFKKTGYVERTAAIAVEDKKTTTISAVLDPTPETQEAFGTELFQKVVQSLGGADGLKELGSVQAVGNTTLWTCDSRSVRWTLLMRNTPDRALFQVTANKGVLHEALFVGGQYKTGKKKAPDALELVTDFGFIRDNQLSALLAKLGNSHYKFRANHPDPLVGEEFSLTAEDGTETISIGFDKDYLPQRVRILTSSGVSASSISYSDYVRGEKTFYPRNLQIKPDGWEHGIEVHFDTVQLNPKLDDKSFRLRGKRLADLPK